MNDFAADPTAVQDWRSIDDRIMGGCSLSRAEFVDGDGLRFRGVVSFDNGGGFASIRSPETDYDLAGSPICACATRRQQSTRHP